MHGWRPGFLTIAACSFGAGALLAGTFLLFQPGVRRLPAAPALSLPLPAAEAESAQPSSLLPFIEVTASCGPHFEGACVAARASATTSARTLARLRTGVVLPVATTTVRDETGREWHEVVFREWIRYPYRVEGTWYVAAENARAIEAAGSEELGTEAASTTKRIVVDRPEQKLYAYDGDELFMEVSISTGLDLTPTPRGVFSVYRKTPSRYMQGPLPGISDQYYDLPGVPWNLYFTKEGGAIHGAYWHDEFGKQRSHGCVNLPLAEAERLYRWADLGTAVVVQD